MSLGTIGAIFGICTAVLSIITFFLGRTTSLRNSGYDAGMRDAKLETSINALTEKIDLCINKIDGLTEDKVEKKEYNKLISLVESMGERLNEVDGKGDYSHLLHNLKE